MKVKQHHTIYLVFNISLLSFVKMHLNESCAIQLDADPLANNFRRIAQVFKNGIVHRSQCPTEIKSQQLN